MLPLSRREFSRIALAALPAASVVTLARQLGAEEAATTVRGKHQKPRLFRSRL
jgi:hypothetical protein